MHLTGGRRTYDHRLRELAYHAGDPGIAQQLGVPRSTARSWIRRGMPDVVSLEVADKDAVDLRARVLQLEQRIVFLLTVVRLLFTVLRALNIGLDDERIPSAEAKARLLTVVERARRKLKLTVVLRIMGLSPSRYHAWTKRQVRCQLQDASPCPRSSPGRLTAVEIRTMHELTTSMDLRHMSVRALALHAQRLGRVFARAGTWLG